jgi:N-methylhydantoinase B
MQSTDEIVWDGKVYPYIAPDELTIDPSLAFHDALDEALDPVTYEVLRHAIWNVNIEHGNTILKISGSPICAYSHDFNPSILDEHGGAVFSGPFLQSLGPASRSAVKWTLEYRSENPGIGPGDVFLFNDPWVAANHQTDVGVIAPVFIDGGLFCWVANSIHQWDLGGTAPGGFNPIAENVFWEAPCIPPVRIVEGGVMRRDIEEYYTRASRVPDLVALDLRAALTGCRGAVERIQGLCGRYGAGTVKATMRKLQDDSEAAFLRRLRTIPDGTWSEEGWIEVALPGDRGVYKNQLTLTKRGDTLIYSNRGSAPQAGSLSGTFGGWKGSILSFLNVTMMYDQMLCIEGALRHCQFDIEPGLINSATRPTAVEAAPAATLTGSIGLGGMVLSKMLATSSDAELRSEVVSCMGGLSCPINGMTGIDQRGNTYSSFLLDPAGAALAASSWGDGQDTGGWGFDLQSTMPNVENNELFYPLLYLWRKELPDSGGAGRFRGGNGCEMALVPHKTEEVEWVTMSSQVAVPAPGLFGGYPTSTNSFLNRRGARIWDQIAESGRMPTTPEEIPGEDDWVPAKTADRRPTPDDVWIFSWSGAGGYGDPIERDVEAVRADVAAGRVTAAWAEHVYGVVLSGEGEHVALDERRTAERRQAIIDERLSSAKRRNGAAEPASNGAGGEELRLTEYLRIVGGEIRAGDISLGPASGNYKDHALILDRPITEANPHIRDPRLYTDQTVEFRQIIAPETGRLLETEIVVDGSSPRRDAAIGIQLEA